MSVSATSHGRLTVDWGQGTNVDGGTTTLYTAPADCSYAEIMVCMSDTNQTDDGNYSSTQFYTGGTGENDLFDNGGNTFRTGSTWDGFNGGRFLGTRTIAAGQDIRLRSQVVAGSPGTLGFVWVARAVYAPSATSGTLVRRTRSTWGQGTGSGYVVIYTPPADCLYAEVWVEHNDTNQTDDANYSGASLYLGGSTENHLWHNSISTFRTGDTDRRNGSASFSPVWVPGGVDLRKRSGNAAGSPGTLGYTYRAVEYYG